MPVSIDAATLEPPTADDSRSSRKAGRQVVPRWTLVLVLGLGAALAFGLHFRPWEAGFLEEWPLAEFWKAEGGVAFFAQYGPWSLSRPLHLVPTAMGLALSGGAPGGIFVILGLTAAAQFLAFVWAVRPLRPSFWLASALGLVVALHPLWPGGYLQRFLPAQVAALGLIVAAGFFVRWLVAGRVRTLLFAMLAIIVGLCVYPGAAAAAGLVALVLALALNAPLRRRVWAVAAAIAAAALVTVYSLVITRLIAPDAPTYESGNLAAGAAATPHEFVDYLIAVLSGPGLLILAGVVLVALLGPLLSLSGAVPHVTGWLVTGAAVVSPLCAVVFIGNAAWLQDPERIAYATSLGLIAALLVWPATSRQARLRLQVVVAAVLAVAAVWGGVRAVAYWQPYIALQHQLFEELAPVVAEASGDEIVVVVDHSGTYGSEYTLPQLYISSASHVMNDDDTRVWLCALASDPRLGNTPVCDPADTGDDLRLIKSFAVPNGSVDLFIGTPPQSD